jgi:transcriptional regulator with XRE-family HTH domain
MTIRTMNTQPFGDWLRNQLTIKRMSQNQLARELGIKQSAVSYWKRGKRVPRPVNCRKITTALNLDADVVLAAAGHRPMPKPFAEAGPEAILIAKVQTVDWLRNEGVYALIRDMLDNIIETQKFTEPLTRSIFEVVYEPD